MLSAKRKGTSPDRDGSNGMKLGSSWKSRLYFKRRNERMKDPLVKDVVSEKKILDVTCGGRSIWFNKKHPLVLYCDKERRHHTGVWKSGNGVSERTIDVSPDVIADFTDLPFDDNSFSLVVFDPPHLKTLGDNA